jgi:uncharacterized protein with FMN-binding domain
MTNKMAKKGWALVMVVLLGILAGCPQETDSASTVTKHAPYGTAPDYFTGDVNDNASANHDGGPCMVKIKLTLDKGYVTAVDFTGSTGNTAGIGLDFLNGAPAKIIETNSVDVDVVTGASAGITKALVKLAGNKALAKIPGYTPD